MDNPTQILNTEHELIDKLLRVFKKKLAEMKETKKIDTQFIDIVKDCFESFINRVHHWKEENVLFKELKEKDLSPEHEQIVNKLVGEHDIARKLINKIVEAQHKYTIGDISGFDELVESLERFITLYEPHIAFENENFFPEANKYFNEDEQIGLKAKFDQIESQGVIQTYSIILENLERN